MKAGKALGPSGIVVEMIRAAGDMGASNDSWPRSCNHSRWQGTLWLGAEFHCLPLQGKGGCIGKGQLPQSQAGRAGYENPGEDCGQPHQTVGFNRRFPVRLHPRQRHYRRNLCCQAAAREVSSCRQETVHGFRRPGEGGWSSTSEGHLVGAEKTWCGGVDCVSGAGDVCKCVEPCPCWWGVQWRVWSEGWCSPRISTQPAALHHCAWSLITWVPLWGPLGGPLCRWPCYHRWIAWGMCQEALDLERSNGEERTESKCRPCTVCRTGVGSNSIFCNGCKHWVHKKCSGLKHLTKDPDYRCTRCRGTARPLDGRPQKEVQVIPGKLEVVPTRHALSSRWLCTLTTTCVKTAWKKFKDLLPVLSSRHLSFKTHGHVYSSCVQSTMLHASETWPLTKPNLQCLQRNDRAMIRQICNVRPQDTVTTRSSELLARLGIEDLDLILKERRLWWYGHVECSNGPVKTVFHIQVEGKHGPGRPKMTWKKLTERDCREWKLSAINPHDRNMWRSGVRSAMCAASQLSGRGATDVDVAPVPAC